MIEAPAHYLNATPFGPAKGTPQAAPASDCGTAAPGCDPPSSSSDSRHPSHFGGSDPSFETLNQTLDLLHEISDTSLILDVLKQSESRLSLLIRDHSQYTSAAACEHIDRVTALAARCLALRKTLIQLHERPNPPHLDPNTPGSSSRCGTPALGRDPRPLPPSGCGTGAPAGHPLPAPPTHLGTAALSPASDSPSERPSGPTVLSPGQSPGSESALFSSPERATQIHSHIPTFPTFPKFPNPPPHSVTASIANDNPINSITDFAPNAFAHDTASAPHHAPAKEVGGEREGGPFKVPLPSDSPSPSALAPFTDPDPTNDLVPLTLPDCHTPDEFEHAFDTIQSIHAVASVPPRKIYATLRALQTQLRALEHKTNPFDFGRSLTIQFNPDISDTPFITNYHDPIATDHDHDPDPDPELLKRFPTLQKSYEKLQAIKAKHNPHSPFTSPGTSNAPNPIPHGTPAWPAASSAPAAPTKKVGGEREGQPSKVPLASDAQPHPPP